jgi:hypothetical protein
MGLNTSRNRRENAPFLVRHVREICPVCGEAAASFTTRPGLPAVFFCGTFHRWTQGEGAEDVR